MINSSFHLHHHVTQQTSLTAVKVRMIIAGTFPNSPPRKYSNFTIPQTNLFSTAKIPLHKPF